MSERLLSAPRNIWDPVCQTCVWTAERGERHRAVRPKQGGALNLSIDAPLPYQLFLKWQLGLNETLFTINRLLLSINEPEVRDSFL